MISQDDIGHEVGDPNAHWDMRGELLWISEPGPWGSMCRIKLVGTGEIMDVGARGFVRTFGRPVHKTEKQVREDRLRSLREERDSLNRQIKELEAEAP